MGPKAFITCYVCFREFGSRSIPFHEPKCLERWRSSNRSLPPEKRSTTPVKPIGWKHSTDSTWLCTNCQVSVPSAKRGEHAANCFGKCKSSSPLLQTKTTSNMAAGTKVSSPKKGKENKNSINNKSNIVLNGDNVKSDHSNQKPDLQIKKNGTEEEKSNKVIANENPESEKTSQEPQSPQKGVSTSNRSVRPQTKILRRPTPNLKHPVIQVDSDESGDNSDKSKDENPKRMKHNNSETSNEQKPKNFIMYNKYNVDKNIKNSPKERVLPAPQKDVPAAIPSGPSGIPFPCNSCNRSVAPERLHSHAKKDARGLMLKKAASSEAKTPSPQKKVIAEDKSIKEQNKNQTQDTGKEVRKEKVTDDSDKRVTASPKVVASSVAKKNLSNNNSTKSCYICGREPGPFVLPSHEAKCLERWKKENGLLSPTRRKLSPKKPRAESEKNTVEKKPEVLPDTLDPAWQAVQTQLVPCPSCSRTFFPERLPIHQRVCKGKLNAGQSLVRASSLREQSMVQGEEDSGERTSIYVPCYICGRNFGSWVIQMHESQCLRKWRRENEKLEEHLQQQEPHKPQLVLNAQDQPDVETTADVAWESHLQQLVPCNRCSRTFFPDRLEIHARSCRGPAPSKQQQQHQQPLPPSKSNKTT